MKCFWKKLLSLCLVMCLLMAGMPSIGASAEKENAVPEQTSSVNWEELLSAGRSNFTLPEEGTYAPNRLLVTRMENPRRNSMLYHSSIKSTSELFSLPMPQEVQAAVMTLDAAPEEQIVSCTALSLFDGSDMLAVMEDISQQEGVLAVEFDRLRTVSDEPVAPPAPVFLAPVFPEDALPNRDPLVAQQTWLDSMGATKAWDMLAAKGTVPGEGVIVAVLDTGITQNHPDLKDQIVPGGRQFSATDDSFDLITANDEIEDVYGHGTHVSGIIAGAKNGTGITGVAYGAKILPIKVLNDDGHGYDSGIAIGMQYAAGLVDEDGNSVSGDPIPRCDIANMSLGGNTGEPTFFFEIVVSVMRELDIFLVVAAGNEETATSYVHPANNYSIYTSPSYITGAFSVMAMQEAPDKDGDYLTAFSNWDSNPYAGPEYTIMAPGRNILSSITEEGGSYDAWSGTSMASPTVAGAAALVLSANPSYSAENLWSVLATSGKTRQGKTDGTGKTYSYHTLDVVAALNTNPDTVKSVVKGTATGYWREVLRLSILNNSALVIPMDGTKPQVSLNLRGFDGEAFNVTATGAGLAPTGDELHYLAPGSEAMMVFTLNEKPTDDTFKTDIVINWMNADGTRGSETVPVELSVLKAAAGSEIPDIATTTEYRKNSIPMLWVVEDETTISINPNDVPKSDGDSGELGNGYVLADSYFYFGDAGSLEVTGDTDLLISNSSMIDPQVSGRVKISTTTIASLSTTRTGRSALNIKELSNCNIEGYNSLDLTVDGVIEYCTIANCVDTTVTAKSVLISSFVNNFSFMPENERIIKIVVTESIKNSSAPEDAPETGFCQNAVVGPAEVYSVDGSTHAIIKDCYFLPTNDDTSLPFNIPSDKNKLDCEVGSTVYIEGIDGTTAGQRPAMLEDCPTFLISTKRVEGEGVTLKDTTIAYRLVSEFSQNAGKADFGYTAEMAPFGNDEAGAINWADDGKSCTYTVYTSAYNMVEYDYYSLTGLSTPHQFDAIHPIHDRDVETAPLKVTGTSAGDSLEITWDYPAEYDHAKLMGGTLTWGPVGEIPGEREITDAELLAKKVIISDFAPDMGTKHSFAVALWSDETTNPAFKAEGETAYYEPYVPAGDNITMHGSEHGAIMELAVSGTDTSSVMLCADRSFDLNKGLRAIISFDGKAMELAAVAPTKEIALFSGVAQYGDVAVAEIAPAMILKGIDTFGQFVPAGSTLGTLTFRGKNVASEGSMKIILTDFAGFPLKDKEGNEITFTLPTKTTVRSSGGDYTPPTPDSTTLPDGTLVTTVKNPDGSIQIVYVRPDGVRSTVKTPAKGGQSTASIALPADMAGKSVSVPIPMTQGNATTVAVLVGTDGKEQVLTGSYWKNGVLTVPLTGNANIIIRDNAKTFTDLKSSDWFAAGVAFVASHEIFHGVGDGRFAPYQPTSRAMIFTVLQRLTGEPAAPKQGETWYDSGMTWVKETGISSGDAPTRAITRQELVSMLYRYAKLTGMDVSVGEDTNILSYNDAFDVSQWAIPAFQWACGAGIIQGANDNLNPNNTATRAEVASILERFVGMAAK